MVPNVFTVGGKQLEIVRSVVGSIVIYVMHNFFCEQLTTEIHLHHESMLVDVLAIDEHFDVAIRSDPSSAFPMAGLIANTPSQQSGASLNCLRTGLATL